MNTEQLERLVNALVDRITNGQAQLPLPSPLELPSRVSWTQLPRLDLSQTADIDNWFMSFEARMTAARVPEEHWGAKFLECPSVDESLKVRARGLEPLSFSALRRTILKEHGPIDPVNYFKRELYRVKGTNAEDIRESLMKLLTLHNRAARDDGSQLLQERDLCYPFIEALPQAAKSHLERQFALIFAQAHPFEHLYLQAPSKRHVEECHLTQAVEAVDNEAPDTISNPELAEAVALVLQHARRSQPSRPDSRKRGRFQASTPNGNRTPLSSRTVISPGSCAGCGGHCTERSKCPAASKQCSACGLTGHFARVCRKSHPFLRSPAKTQ